VKDKSKFKSFASTLLLIAAGMVSIFFAGFLRVDRSNAALEPLLPPAHISKFSLGYSESLADLFWIRSLQDFDFCGSSGVTAYGIQVSKSQPSQSKYQPGPESKCNHGWLYRILETVTELAPKFEAPYVHGALSLSVLVDDRAGAKALYDKGVMQYPKNWTLSYRAAYHYLIELNEPGRAAELYLMAAKNGAPVWVYSLASRLYSQEGKSDVATKVILEAIDEYGEKMPEFKTRLLERLEAIKRNK
jgi:hypothetical protein